MDRRFLHFSRRPITPHPALHEVRHCRCLFPWMSPHNRAAIRHMADRGRGLIRPRTLEPPSPPRNFRSRRGPSVKPPAHRLANMAVFGHARRASRLITATCRALAHPIVPGAPRHQTAPKSRPAALSSAGRSDHVNSCGACTSTSRRSCSSGSVCERLNEGWPSRACPLEARRGKSAKQMIRRMIGLASEYLEAPGCKIQASSCFHT